MAAGPTSRFAPLSFRAEQNVPVFLVDVSERFDRAPWLSIVQNAW
jgi:hypothetical protein